MMYTERLIKFVKAHDGLFTTSDIASLWKRHKFDVWLAADFLYEHGIVKSPDGVLKLTKKGITYA